MANITVRNKFGKVIGTIINEATGQRILDKNGKVLGRFNAKQNTTSTTDGRFVGTENQLATLLNPEE